MRRGGRKNSGGYTLIELVVALSVSAVLFASMIAVMAPVYRIYARTRERSDAQLVAGTVLDSIRATCSNARSLTADGDRLLVGETAVFSQAGGYLLLDGDTTDELPPDMVLATGVYNGKTVSLGFSQDGDAVRVSVTVSGADGAVCTLESTIRSMRDVLKTPQPDATPAP